MKIKQVFAQICLLLLVLFAVQALVGGFVFSASATYSSIFIVLYVSTAWLATRVRRFFLLPHLLPLDIVLHSSFIAGLMYLSNHIISGITIGRLTPAWLLLLSNTFSQKSFGEFGTIILVSFLCGTVYQVINWLYSDK